MKYPPLFRRIPADPQTTGKKIHDTQDLYESFWLQVHWQIKSNSEKTMAMRKMQESCQWLCRSIAIADFDPDADSKTKKD